MERTKFLCLLFYLIHFYLLLPFFHPLTGCYKSLLHFINYITRSPQSFLADSPSRYVALHWLSWLISLTGICGLVVARGHYSIDVVLAYFVTSRLWWIYHAMATSDKLKYRSEDNFLARAWWYWIFYYFEKNVPSTLPRRYAISTPSVILKLWSGIKNSCSSGCKCKYDESELIENQNQDKEDRRDVV